MAAPTEVVSDADLRKEKFYVIEATVVSGFEPVAKEEAIEKLGARVKEHRGKIIIECPNEKVEQVIQLGCVDNCRVSMKYIPNFKFTDDQNENLRRLRNLVGDIDWSSGLQIWERFFSFQYPIEHVPSVIPSEFGGVTPPPFRPHNKEAKLLNNTEKWVKRRKGMRKSRKDKKEIQKNVAETEAVFEKDGKTVSVEESVLDYMMPSEEINETDKIASNVEQDKLHNNNSAMIESTTQKPKERENPWNPLKPSFRVTCNRSGNGHNFDSMTAASNFGGAIYQYFGWNVKMTDFDIEVILAIEGQEVTVSLGLTRESLHRRNICDFGPTTLRPTVAHGLLRLCELQLGDIVCDPMCGSGSIPVQASLCWPYTMNICGEIAKRAINRCNNNLHYMNEKRTNEAKNHLLVDPVRWNVGNMPLRDSSVDVMVSDLPFGVRMGHKVDNWKLYPRALTEMARVVKPDVGRCCLLTEDKKCINKTLFHLTKYWQKSRILGINLGGLSVGVYVLKRTHELFNNADKDICLFESKKGTKSLSANSEKTVTD